MSRFAKLLSPVARSPVTLSLALVPLLLLAPSAAQQVTGLQAAAAIEGAMVDAIAQAEQSVVAIARVRRLENQPLEIGVNPFGRPLLADQASPGTAEFIPNEYATGVVVDAGGLILTAAHVLQDDCDYWVTTPDRRIYKVIRPKAADPRSDLAVLEIDATGLVPIKFGDGSQLKKGQIVIALGNPYAIARDGQASASWGIVSNLTRKAGPSPDPFNPKPSLPQYGTLIQTDARLNLGTSGGALVNLQGEMVGLTISLAAAHRLRAIGRFRDAGRRDVSAGRSNSSSRGARSSTASWACRSIPSLSTSGKKDGTACWSPRPYRELRPSESACSAATS